MHVGVLVCVYCCVYGTTIGQLLVHHCIESRSMLQVQACLAARYL
jgi:hypothetical protein